GDAEIELHLRLGTELEQRFSAHVCGRGACERAEHQANNNTVHWISPRCERHCARQPGSISSKRVQLSYWPVRYSPVAGLVSLWPGLRRKRASMVRSRSAVVLRHFCLMKMPPTGVSPAAGGWSTQVHASGP